MSKIMSTGTGSLNVLKDELEGLLKKGTIDNDRLITLAHCSGTVILATH